MSMRTAALLLMVWMAAPLPAQQAIYIDSNTPAAGGCNGAPFSVYPNWRFLMLIPAPNLPASRFKVTDVAVAPCASATFTASQAEIRMCAVPAQSVSTVFAQNLSACPITVFRGGMKLAAVFDQWCDLGQQASFAYDGTTSPQKSLVIDMCLLSTSANMTVHSVPSPNGSNYVQRVWAPSSTPNPCTLTTGGTDQLPGSGAPKLRLTIDSTSVMTCPETVRVGSTAVLRVDNAPVGQYYQIAASFGDWPPLRLGKCSVALTLDDLFTLSVRGLPIFANYGGKVPSGGTCTGQLAVPKIPPLAGFRVYHAAICYGTGGLSACTNTCGMQFAP
jgi:hypothetical protein